MEKLRKFFNWIQRNPYLSGGIFVGVVICFVAYRNIARRSEGILSDPLQRGTISQSVYGIGTVLASKTFQIKPGVTSTVRDLYVREGESVQKGAKLIKLEAVVYTAPFDGTVSNLPVKIGENVFAQLPALTLVNLADRYLVVSLEQQGALRVRPGQKAKLSFDTLRQESFDGVVESLYSFGGNFLARIDVSKLPPQILPDMTADVAISISEKENALLIPVASIAGDSVWVKRWGSIPRKVKIKTGIIDASTAEVASGDLKPGDRVLIKTKGAR